MAYVVDTNNHTVRVVTSSGVVTTLAGLAGSSGSTNGTGSAARFNTPQGIAVDGSGTVYVADTFNHSIRRVAAGGVVTTLAGLASTPSNVDGPDSVARFKFPQGVAVGSSGTVYVGDTNNHTIRSVTSGGVVTTLAGFVDFGSTDGTGSGARFGQPFGAAVDATGTVYVADRSNHTIRKITSTGVVSTLAGSPGSSGATDATGSAARFNSPLGIAVDGAGFVYVADQFNCKIRKITPAGVVSTLAGGGICGISPAADGTGTAARFLLPAGLAIDSAGTLYVADQGSNTIRRVTSSGVVTTLAGSASSSSGSADGTGSAARFNLPGGIAVDSAGTVYVADTNNSTIRKVTSGGVVTTLAGSAGAGGGTDGTGGAARFSLPAGIAVDGTGTLYVTSGSTIRKITSAGVVTTVAGLFGVTGNADGIGLAARFDGPIGIAVNRSGSRLYVAEWNNNDIRVGRMLGGAVGNGDLDGDSATDIAVFRPSTGYWYIEQSSTNNTTSVAYQWGESTDVTVPGDYDGDGRADLAVYRPSTGYWYILLSSTNYATYIAQPWGISTDVPVPGDYDGDGKTDLAVYRPSTGYWYILQSSTNNSTYVAQPWGISSDVAVPGDYDGDGKADLAVYRPSTGYWYILQSSTNFSTYVAQPWGISTDVPVPGDYDGDGKTDLAVYRPSTGYWYILQSSTNYSTYVAQAWGISSDVTVPGDYDGDGKTDLAVYRPSTGYWYILQSSTNYTTYVAQPWGLSTDIPVLKRQ